MRISILGPGEIKKVTKYTDISKEELLDLISKIGKLLAGKEHEIVIIPNKGIPLEIARIYKENKGKKVLGIIPTQDKDYGNEHVKDYSNLIDEKIEVDSWYDADGKIAAEGELCLIIGLSAGVIRAVAALKFHYKYRNCKTKIVWFENTISDLIQKEIEEEVPINYISSIKELEQFL